MVLLKNPLEGPVELIHTSVSGEGIQEREPNHRTKSYLQYLGENEESKEVVGDW